jgi:hypothetical protein
MTEPVITNPVTAGTFLFGGGGLAELAHRLTDSGALRQAHDALATAGHSGWDAVTTQLASMTQDFLSLDLASVALAGWRKHQELVDVAERLDGTAASAVVPLWTQDISLTQNPHVDLVAGTTTVSVIEFELKVDISMVGICRVVRGGSLVAFQGGQGEVTVSFSAAGVCVAKRVARFDPRLTIPLGAGIPLVTGPRAAAPAPPGWYRAPHGEGQQWWDGHQWTEHRTP